MDVPDSYSRYLIDCKVLLLARTKEVTVAIQRAREKLSGRLLLPGGLQFISQERRAFVQSLGLTDVRTHPCHPQSNGRDERLHRTRRDEWLLDDDATLYPAQEVIEHYRFYYNYHRPHSALH